MTGETQKIDEDDGSEETTLDMEMALLAMSATNDVGGPLQEIDLSTLSAEEKRTLLAYLRRRFNFAPDPDDLRQDLHEWEEPPTPSANQDV